MLSKQVTKVELAHSCALAASVTLNRLWGAYQCDYVISTVEFGQEFELEPARRKADHSPDRFTLDYGVPNQRHTTGVIHAALRLRSLDGYRTAYTEGRS